MSDSPITLITMLDTREAAARLGIPSRTLEGLRLRGGGPPFVKIGRSCRYRVADLVKWIDANTVSSTSELAAGE